MLSRKRKTLSTNSKTKLRSREIVFRDLKRLKSRSRMINLMETLKRAFRLFKPDMKPLKRLSQWRKASQMS